MGCMGLLGVTAPEVRSMPTCVTKEHTCMSEGWPPFVFALLYTFKFKVIARLRLPNVFIGVNQIVRNGTA
eukprot:scaffold188761_cov16-Tisochrysis_lutea.AAC.1